MAAAAGLVSAEPAFLDAPAGLCSELAGPPCTLVLGGAASDGTGASPAAAAASGSEAVSATAGLAAAGAEADLRSRLPGRVAAGPLVLAAGGATVVSAVLAAAAGLLVPAGLGCLVPSSFFCFCFFWLAGGLEDLAAEPGAPPALAGGLTSACPELRCAMNALALCSSATQGKASWIDSVAQALYHIMEKHPHVQSYTLLHSVDSISVTLQQLALTCP